LLPSLALFRRSSPVSIETERIVLRLPEMTDHPAWSGLRRSGEAFLRAWEPVYAPDYLTRRAFRNRVYWAHRSREEGRALSLFLVRRADDALMGAITLDNIRRGPAQMANVGYWIGPDFARQGYMLEALNAVVDYAQEQLDLGRIEAACLPENAPSRSLLLKAGFAEEGLAAAYLQIAGRWRDHVLYARLRDDRRDGLRG
jgi:ribosomal-protein-alanine N-acetyltransferase